MFELKKRLSVILGSLIVLGSENLFCRFFHADFYKLLARLQIFERDGVFLGFV